MTRPRLLIYLVVAAALVSAIAAYLHERDRRVTTAAAASARIERDSALLDSLRRRRPALDTVLVATLDTVRVAVRRVDTLVRTMPPETRRETLYVAALDTLSRRCEQCATAAQAYRDTAHAEISALGRMNADLRVLADRPRRGPVRLGLGAGYGLTLAGDGRLVHGPTISVGVTITP